MLAVEVGLVGSGEGEVVTVIVGDVPCDVEVMGGEAVSLNSSGGRCPLGSSCRRSMLVPGATPCQEGAAVRGGGRGGHAYVPLVVGADTATSIWEERGMLLGCHDPAGETAGEASSPLDMVGTSSTGGAQSQQMESATEGAGAAACAPAAPVALHAEGSIDAVDAVLQRSRMPALANRSACEAVNEAHKSGLGHVMLLVRMSTSQHVIGAGQGDVLLRDCKPAVVSCRASEALDDTRLGWRATNRRSGLGHILQRGSMSTSRHVIGTGLGHVLRRGSMSSSSGARKAGIDARLGRWAGVGHGRCERRRLERAERAGRDAVNNATEVATHIAAASTGSRCIAEQEREIVAELREVPPQGGHLRLCSRLAIAGCPGNPLSMLNGG